MNSSKISLEGKVALVTGGSRGIGRAAALKLADAGATVVVASRRLPDLEVVADEIKAKGARGAAISVHMGKKEEIKSLVDRTMADFGRIDILCNNAGTNPYYGPIMDAEEWAWDKTMDVNLKGPFLLAQLVARIMKEQGGGSIIQTGSVASLRADMLNIYGVTKAALMMLSEVMAKEWGQYGIRVNTIAPGIIKTRLSEALWKDPEVGETARQSMAMLRLGEPEDVGDVILFLASDLSRYITGVTIAIDGGQMLGAPAWLGGKTAGRG